MDQIRNQNSNGADSVSHEAGVNPDRVVNIVELFSLLAANKSLIAKITAVSALAALLVAVLLPLRFTGHSKIMPPEKSPSASSALMTQIGGLSNLGGAASLVLKNPSDLYVAVLQSREIADALVRRFSLLRSYGVKYQEDARDQLKNRTVIKSSNEGVITISVEDGDPQKAADLANGYVEELRNLLQNIGSSEAAQRKQYFETQLSAAQDQLHEAEVELKQTQQKTGLIQPESQSRAIVQSIAALQSDVLAAQMRVNRVRLYSNESNPELVRAERDLASLQSELANVQHKSSSIEGGVLLSTKDVPQAGLEYLRSMRKFTYRENLFAALAKQYEIAKLDESRNQVTVEFLERAVRPERKSWPPRLTITLMGTLAGLLFSVAFILLRQSLVQLGYLHSDRIQALAREIEFSAVK